MMDRRGLLISAAAASAASLLPRAAARAFEREGDRRILVFSGGQPVPVLDPHVRYDWSTRMMQQCCYDALAKYVDSPARIIHWLAESRSTSEDGLTWTFKLVQNAKFHNGDPVDAEAVRFSYERALRLNKGVAWMLKDHLDPTGIEAVDARTVKITLKQPYPAFLSFVPWWYVVNPKQVLANQDNNDLGERWLTTNEAGSGPFKIKRWDPQAVMALEAIPDYWRSWPQGEADRPAGVIYRVMREPAARKAALTRGEVDVITEMTADDMDQIAKQPNMVVTRDPGMTPFTIMMNCQKGPTADVNVRKALAYAFDYEALIAIHNGAAKLMTSVFPDATVGKIDLDMPRQNLDLARQYLAKTQWPKGGFELEYVHVAGLEAPRRIGLALLNALQPLDIKVNVNAQPWPTMVARGARPETSPDMISVYVTPVSTDPDVVAAQYASTAAGQYWGMHHLRDSDLDKLVADARVEVDQDKRKEAYADIQKLILADQPAIFGMMEDRRWAMRSYVKGYAFCPVRLTGEVDLYPMYVAKG